MLSNIFYIKSGFIAWKPRLHSRCASPHTVSLCVVSTYKYILFIVLHHHLPSFFSLSSPSIRFDVIGFYSSVPHRLYCCCLFLLQFFFSLLQWIVERGSLNCIALIQMPTGKSIFMSSIENCIPMESINSIAKSCYLQKIVKSIISMDFHLVFSLNAIEHCVQFSMHFPDNSFQRYLGPNEKKNCSSIELVPWSARYFRITHSKSCHIKVNNVVPGT